MKFHMPSREQLEKADFLVKSSFGISVITFLIVTPLAINSILQGRYSIGLSLSLINFLCMFSMHQCFKGKYILWLNVFAIVPSISIVNLYAFYTLGVSGAFWAFMIIFAMYFVLPIQYAKIANGIFIIATILIAYKVLEPNEYLRYSVAIVGSSYFVLHAVREIFNQQDQLIVQAVTDSLTGLFNRSSLKECLERSIFEYKTKQRAATICILDIDNFKEINDSLGHDVGDSVIVKLSECIQNAMSGKDIVFRIGGEEFLILMNNTGEKEGFMTAEALRALIEDSPLLENHKVTVSAGVCSVSQDMSWKTWMKNADQKLYWAKRNGRNQVAQ